MENGEASFRNDFCAGCRRQCSFDGSSPITLNLDDGTDILCQTVTIFKAGKRYYIALLPLDKNGENTDGEVYLYRFDDNHGDPQIDNIADDEEYEIASDGFDEWMDENELDEIISAEEAEEEDKER